MSSKTVTIILGLGSNMGCRLTQLRQAVNALEQSQAIDVITISPIYQSPALLPDNALPSWDQPFLNLALRCQTNLQPLALLKQIKQIEKQLGRSDSPRWSPRPIDIDILAWGQLHYQDDQLTIPHAGLLERAFALNPLLDITPNWRHPQSPQQLLTPLTSDNTVKTGLRIKTPHTVGVINVTPDSFSDGGQFEQVADAVQQCQQLIADGAEIIDIGAESTRPGSAAITPEQEWQRLQPVLAAVCDWVQQAALPFKAKISVDSRHATTFAKALNYPIDWINDVDGKDRAEICQMISGSDKRYVAMHNLGFPPQRHRTVTGNTFNQLYQFGEQRINELIQLGLTPEQIIFDVGIGFGKTASQHRQLFQQMHKFRALGVELLVGHSRKSFIHTINPTLPQQRDLETAILTALIAHNGIDYLRVHQVNFTQRALNLVDWYYQEEYKHDDYNESI